ncbi:hypothetical protein KBY90_10610 [Cyanobium sp. CH-040]|nr:hypothetical protein [Cyanobium sp. CH-040]
MTPAATATTAGQEPPSVIGLWREGERSLLESLLDLERRSGAVRAAGHGKRLQERLEQVPAAALSPWIYLLYYRIGQCVLSGRQPSARLELLLDWLGCELPQGPPASGVVSFADAGRPEWQWRDLLELFQEGGDFVADLEGPDTAETDRWREAITAARSLIAGVDPALHGLMEQLQSQVVLTMPGERARRAGTSFGGATTFFFRGGSLINCAARLEPAQLLERLVHEFAHTELFVIGQDSRLCRNDDDERHQVLIRPDPRPMHGIIHALYVSARCAELFRRLLAAELPGDTPGQGPRDGIRAMLERVTALGRSALEAVQKHGQLTETGAGVVAVSRARLDLSGADGR